MEFEKIDILTLLPQQQPFIMVDRLLYCDVKTTKTSIFVGVDSIFVENGELTEAGIMENIAQTCAARMGFINRFLKLDKVKLGFIGAIKNLIIEELPKSGDTLTTTIEVESEVFAITAVNAKVKVNEKLVASCAMKIVITDMIVSSE